jgi:hypothetical protein
VKPCARSRAGMLALGLAALATRPLQAEDRDALGPSVLRMPVLEQKAERGILTPVPIAVTLPGALPARRVLVHYRIHGSKDWMTLELTRQGEEFRGAIPCLEVSTITGDIRYYIRVHDAKGAVIAYSGSRHQPYRVTIRHDSQRPGAPLAADRCPDPADCPPGLPGCPSEQVERIPCDSDSDCEGGLSCGWDGYCERDSRRYNWVSVELEGGVGIVSTAGACSVESQENEGYLCLRKSDGEVYAGRPLHTNEPLAIGSVPPRVQLGFERLIQPESTLGVRVGYAPFGFGPTPPGGSAFIPYSGELRLSRYFGGDPFAGAGLRPYVFVGGGYAMYDVRVSVRVREDLSRPIVQGGNELEQTLDVWRRAGDGFVSAGTGAALMPESALGLSGELLIASPFPYGALVVTARAGGRFGF